MLRSSILRLKRGRHERARTPWIFKADVADVSDMEAGDVVGVVDSGGHFVGRGLQPPAGAVLPDLHVV